MPRCLISFGANLGEPSVTIGQAVQLLQEKLVDHLESLQLSRLFRTPAVGGPMGQPPFVNAVAALQLNRLSAWDVWQVVRQIEHTLGRVRQERWEARRIDLDVLLFDDQRIWTQHFKLPHPRMIMRRFILEPALDVAAHWREPISGWSLQELASTLRRGPASIALVSWQSAEDQPLLERSAMSSQSQWRSLTVQRSAPRTLQSQTTQQLSPQQLTTQQLTTQQLTTQRWLGLIDIKQLNEVDGPVTLQPQPKLVFVLAPAIIKHGAAWEDIHRQLAEWLQLCSGSGRSTWPMSGPRYLLATDDRDWALHEIVAALEAMDCPVEPQS